MSLLTNLEAQNPSLADAGDIKFWLKMDETESGAIDIVDAVGNVTLPMLDAVPDGAGGILFGNNPNIVPSSGTIPSLGTDDWALFYVAKGQDFASLILGDSISNHRIKVSSGASVEIVGAGGTATFGAANDFPASNALEKLLITSVQGGNTTCYTGASGAVLAAGTPQLASVHGNLTAINNVMSIAKLINGILGYEVMLVSFANGLPADIVAMADWTMEQAIADNKKFYPRMTEL